MPNSLNTQQMLTEAFNTAAIAIGNMAVAFRVLGPYYDEALIT